MIQDYLHKIVKDKQHNLSIDERLLLYKTGQYDKLLDAYAMLIRKEAFKYSLVNNDDSFDDIFQEGLLAAWKAINMFNPEVSPYMPSYIMRSAINAMYSYANRAKDKDIFKEELHEAFHVNIQEEISHEDLHFVLSQLSSDDEDLLRVVFFGYSTQKDLAAKIGITRQGLAHRIKNALSKLRVIMKKYDLNLKQ